MRLSLSPRHNKLSKAVEDSLPFRFLCIFDITADNNRLPTRALDIIEIDS